MLLGVCYTRREKTENFKEETMTNYEMVEMLREKANVSYEEAKRALEASNWDLLDAIVLLEREGKVPENNARFSTERKKEKQKNSDEEHSGTSGFKQGMSSLGSVLRRILNYLNRNFLVVSKNARGVLSLPLTAFALLLIFPPTWVVLVLMLVSLFFGFRYSIRGAHPVNEKVNSYIHKAEGAVEHMRQEFQSNGEEPKEEEK